MSVSKHWIAYWSKASSSSPAPWRPTSPVSLVGADVKEGQHRCRGRGALPVRLLGTFPASSLRCLSPPVPRRTPSPETGRSWGHRPPSQSGSWDSVSEGLGPDRRTYSQTPLQSVHPRLLRPSLSVVRCRNAPTFLYSCAVNDL